MIIRDHVATETKPANKPHSAPRPRVLDRVLFLLLDLNCWLRGYSVALARSEQDFEDHRRLVQGTFFGQGHYSDPKTALKAEPPGSMSWIWIARYRGEPIGTLRLIRNRDAWPMDLVLPTRLPEGLQRIHAAEIGRFNVVPRHRRRRWVVTFALLKAAFKLSTQEGIRWWTGCASAHLLLSFMHYSSSIQFLEELPLDASHLSERAGREGYFSSSQKIRGFALDLCQINVIRMGFKALRQRLREGNFFGYKASSN